MSDTSYHQKEIEHFDNLAKHWWDPKGPMRTLHAINPCRLEYICTNTPNLNNKSIVDIGCGGGILSEALAKQNAKVTGIDLSEPAINTAKSHAKSQNLAIDYHVIAAEELANNKPHHFDIVVCMELLEHVPCPETIVKAAKALCAPDGVMFFSTINRNLSAYLSVILAAEHILKLIPKNTHHYEQFIRPAQLAKWCRNLGLQVTDISGISFNPWTHQCKITNNPRCNYLLTCTLKKE